MYNRIKNLINNADDVLFDYDGVLVNSEPLYLRTWECVLTSKGLDICSSIHEGKHESEVFPFVKDYLIDNLTFNQISKKRQAHFDVLVNNGELNIIKGIDKVVNELSKEKKLHIVSNSSEDVVKLGLDSVGFKFNFNQFFCFSPKYPRKPDPFLYLLALNTLNILSDAVVAIEDSISGIEAAISANIPVIGLSKKKEVIDYCNNRNTPYVNSAFELISFMDK